MTSTLREPLTDEQRHLADRHYPLVWFYVNRQARQRRNIDKDELLSMGHDALLRCVRKYQPEAGPFAPYLKRSLSNAIVADAQRIRRQVPLGNVDRPDERRPERLPLEVSEAYERAMAVLTRRERLIISLWLEGSTLRQIASLLGLQCPDSVRQARERALVRCREALASAA